MYPCHKWIKWCNNLLNQSIWKYILYIIYTNRNSLFIRFHSLMQVGSISSRNEKLYLFTLHCSSFQSKAFFMSFSNGIAMNRWQIFFCICISVNLYWFELVRCQRACVYIFDWTHNNLFIRNFQFKSKFFFFFSFQDFHFKCYLLPQ